MSGKSMDNLGKPTLPVILLHAMQPSELAEDHISLNLLAFPGTLACGVWSFEFGLCLGISIALPLTAKP